MKKLRAELILNDPLLNKGTGFSRDERDALGLNGLLPYHVSTIEEQVQRRYANFRQQTSHLAKYEFLSALQNRNETLFYRLVYEHIDEMLPYVYTPTVGDVSLQYSLLYREQRGLYLSYPLKDEINAIIESIPKENLDVIVVTDGERILGLGDLGIGGMAIPVGKLSLYTLFGGIHPARSLPILLDVGTNNPKLLDDPLYLGWRHKRVTGEAYDSFVAEFVSAIKKRFPKTLLQWEDFAKPHAKPLLTRYRKELCSFNDDIQGTAAVVLAALLSAVKATKKSLKEQRIAVFGGGGAGIGICNQLLQALMAEGLPEREARGLFYVIDRFGLIHTRLEEIEEEQCPFAQDFDRISSWGAKTGKQLSLLDVVKHAKPTILIGVSAQAGAFTEEVVRAMAAHTDRPIIFPLSNPNSHSEAEPKDLIAWTHGKAIVATGSPFDAVSYQGERFPISQCNNVYVYPGVGLGVIASHATYVSDAMFLVAAQVLSSHSPLLRTAHGPLFPFFKELRAVSREIGIAVGRQAQKEGYAKKTSEEELIRMIDQTMWFPAY